MSITRESALEFLGYTAKALVFAAHNPQLYNLIRAEKGKPCPRKQNEHAQGRILKIMVYFDDADTDTKRGQSRFICHECILELIQRDFRQTNPGRSMVVVPLLQRSIPNNMPSIIMLATQGVNMQVQRMREIKEQLSKQSHDEQTQTVHTFLINLAQKPVLEHTQKIARDLLAMLVLQVTQTL